MYYTVQDVAFQLERMVAGMYVYYRQSYRSLKPTAVFPIEVELGINLQDNKRNFTDEQEIPLPSSSIVNSEGPVESQEDQRSSPLPSIDNLLLDLGLEDNPMTSSNQ